MNYIDTQPQQAPRTKLWQGAERDTYDPGSGQCFQIMLTPARIGLCRLGVIVVRSYFMTRCDHAPDRFEAMRGEMRRSIESYPQIEPVKHLQQGFPTLRKKTASWVCRSISRPLSSGKSNSSTSKPRVLLSYAKSYTKKFFSSRTNTSPDIFDMTTPSRNVVFDLLNPQPFAAFGKHDKFCIEQEIRGCACAASHSGLPGKALSGLPGYRYNGYSGKPVQHPGAMRHQLAHGRQFGMIARITYGNHHIAAVKKTRSITCRIDSLA